MNEEHTPQEESREPLSVVACLSAGFDIVARHPWLILIPVLLDLLLWLGPRLSIAPMLLGVQGFIHTSLTTQAPTAEAREAYIIVEQSLEQLAASYDLFGFISPAPILGVPVLMPKQLTVARPLTGDRPEIVAATLPAAVLWVGLILGVGAAFSAAYLMGIGYWVLQETESPLPGANSLSYVAKRLLALFAWLIAFIGLFATGGGLLIGVAGMLSPTLSGLLVLFLVPLAFFILLHLIFVVPGVVQMRREPWQAMHESILLTRADIVNASLLILLMMLLAQGFMVIWQLADPAEWTMLISIVGHAVLNTALTAAVFIFYQERLNFLKIVQKIFAIKDVSAHPVAGE